MPDEELMVSTGTLLASAPNMLDPNFMHTVSVICDHTDAGAYGMVINKRSSLTIDRLLPDHPILGRLALPVNWGGPVENDTLQVLHRFPDLIPGGMELASGLFLGGDLDAVADVVGEEASPWMKQGVRFILGCAGWGGGQLELELAGGSWLPLACNADYIFTELGREPARGQDRVWKMAMRSLGGDGQELAAMPPDIGWN
ncbi:MAG: putative transcriptional regulator [Candidatus Paceibacteria bacterium]|jgi:putative transcriptional regulator